MSGPSARDPAAARAWWWLAAIVLGATALRVYVLTAGPDLDTDAYGHALLGRYAWADPGNLQIHWVWLPLWHFSFGLAGWLGLGFQAVRWFDVALSALIPVLVFVTVRGARREPSLRNAVALLAAAFAALFPIAVTHGQSAEPEALFCVLLLSAALCVERGARVLASVALAVAVLLRFEAWASLPAFALASVLHTPRIWSWRRRIARGGLAVLLPGLTILLYVWLHHLAYDRRWLVFLTENHAFVREARSRAVPGIGPQPVWFWYLASLPYRTAGPVVVLAAIGAWRFAQRAPLSYRLVGPWLLAFVSYGWVREQHLGLDRHFFAVVPFYALAMAEGAALLAERARPRQWLVALAVAGPVLLMLGFSVYHARVHARAAALAFLPEREMAARLLAEAPEPGSVYCASPKVEVLSGLHHDRFAAADAVLERAASGRRVTVVDDLAHRDRWPAAWRSVGSTPELVVLAGP